jgi:hypothetical protein
VDSTDIFRSLVIMAVLCLLFTFMGTLPVTAFISVSILAGVVFWLANQ